MWVSGPRAFCTRCDSTRLRFVTERYDRIDGVHVGTVNCRACGASLLYSRSEKQRLPQYDPPQPQPVRLPF